MYSSCFYVFHVFDDSDIKFVNQSISQSIIMAMMMMMMMMMMITTYIRGFSVLKVMYRGVVYG